ncbi:NAD-glutamate dehydrogenase [Alkalilimnicola sp. S0819]|uniref:NAD-glutamate dehydrogenase n=1 Tax=Alkalilimnicola sp. S0819 TaxID=2613922 RepID=UPI00126224E5|nr:NAD-glutamate dehydrogenase [Alkalilimnicola sp. S0819]KAB7622676.1 NAD-glutamate dehydrogenase [Alkalilimnicola sp. S0819]MPQ17313.1 NAD-glutamate dehydrogenase [Alkalilimnicola sp. S0819]
MTDQSERQGEERRERLQQLLRERWPDTQERVWLGQFLDRYYRGVAPEDLAQRPLDDLYGAAVSHWKLFTRQKPGSPRIHAFNPVPEQHGWESAHSIVQIVTDDMPFLVDSVAMALSRLNLTIHLIIHPVMSAARNGRGELRGVEGGEERDSCMHFEVDQQAEEALRGIEREIVRALNDVRAAVEDWQPMNAQLGRCITQLKRQIPQSVREQLDEDVAFLEWLKEDHFTFLGYRRYELVTRRGERQLRAVADSGLGILRHVDGQPRSRSFSALPEEVQREALMPRPLIVTKSNSRATVHRPGYMDYVGIKRFNQRGEVIGEHRFLGLYTSAAYNLNPRHIPLLRRKIDQVLEQAALPPRSHAGKALINILETFPRDELFQIEPTELHRIALGILHLQERAKVRLFLRVDPYRRFVSCLVYAPRERYGTEVRRRMQAILQHAFAGEQAEFSVQLAESLLARIHFIIRLGDQGLPEVDLDALEQELAATTRSWRDDLHRALLDYYGEERGNRLYRRYGEAYSAAYQEDTQPRVAAHDLERLEALSPERPLGLSLYRPLEASGAELRLKLLHHGEPVSLSAVLPMLENMGLEVIDERPYEVNPSGAPARWVHDFGLRHAGGELDTEELREIFQDALAATWRGDAENDGFHRLVLAARLGWREILILRAYSKYLRQAGTTFSQKYFEATLAAWPEIARLLVRLFHARLDPKRADEKRAAQLVTQVEEALNEVPSLDQDRILRRFLAAIQATLRSNFFQTRQGADKPYMSLKLRPAQIPGVPRPHPAYEIFVYSPRVEGVHLRGGKVARGGLRWSDRPEDYRTEVLGLMKAQMVKNAVIVPVGAKGGFIVKQPPEEREARMREVRACYQDFIRGLLDVTDNLVDGRVVAPERTVRHDEDDHYLVVAADKGTASFSDLANEVAAEYGFWLGDAFASGGSSGYDHKGMGITARGAWEAVKRHFRELGKDIQREPFTVVGVGDMSGDVFGNGMLLSEQTRLVAAFDHRHVFIDPTPDPAASYAERQRLFALPRSSWDDYDRDTLSAGGQIYPRSAKRVSLSEQARAALAIEERELTPNELIHRILQAPVELLWNGGIGTYVKARFESHLDVGDKANDPVRVDGAQLRCQVLGEGGNLGVTQAGRIEYALLGGRVNTDAIDNAGGVDTSDHEVNIKIMLQKPIDEGDLTVKQRNRLLARIQDEVAALVLQNNYRQTQALSLCAARAPELLDEHNQLMRLLEREGLLDRALEGLPGEEQVKERALAGQGLTRPELAVLLAYAKIYHYEELLGSELIGEPLLEEELLDYFPGPLRESQHDAILGHRLRAPIIATEAANHIVNRMGASFIHRVRERSGADTADVARAWMATREIFAIKQLREAVDTLDNQVPAAVQTEMLLRINRLHERGSHWLLTNLPRPIPVSHAAEAMRGPAAQLAVWLEDLLAGSDRAALAQQREKLREQGVEENLAGRIADLEMLYTALDISRISRDHDCPLRDAARVYHRAAEELGLCWLREAVTGYQASSPWEERARQGLEDEYYIQLRLLAARLLAEQAPLPDEPGPLQDWVAERIPRSQRLAQTLHELCNSPQLDLAMLAVAVQELNAVVHTATAAPQQESPP